MSPALVVALAYLLGSLPFGYLIVRARGGGDVRESGSGGTGATNVTRRAGRGAGLLTLLLDAAKGFVAVLLARGLLTEDFGVNWWVAASAFAAVFGHVFPLWLKFRGGKGVAPGLGVFLALAPLVVPVALAAFLIVVWRTRYVSLGSIAAAALMPAALSVLDSRFPFAGHQGWERAAAAAAGGALIIYAHRANIRRLLRGTENKLKL